MMLPTKVVSPFGSLSKISISKMVKRNKGCTSCSLWRQHSINFGVLMYPFIVIRYVIIYAHTESGRFNPFSASIRFRSLRPYTQHFWLVSNSLTVSNILMKMRSTSSHTHVPFTRLTSNINVNVCVCVAVVVAAVSFNWNDDVAYDFHNNFQFCGRSTWWLVHRYCNLTLFKSF